MQVFPTARETVFSLTITCDNVYYIHMNSKDIIKMLERDGWVMVRVSGSHHHFRHPSKQGTVTVPHPKKEMKKGTYNSILKQSGLKQ